MSYACPKCKSTELGIVLSCWAQFNQKDGRLSHFSGHDDCHWNEQSPMKCYACGHDGVAAQFHQPEQPT